MSFVNPIDYTGFSSPFKADVVTNQQNRSDAYKRAGAFKRAGDLGGFGAASFGNAIGEQFKIDAGLYAQKQGQMANTVGGLFDLAGGIGGFAAQGGFGGGSQMKGPSVGTFDGAWNTDLNIGGFTPSEILTNPNISYNPFGG